MSDQKKTIAGGLTLASLIAILGAWPYLEPVVTWAWANLGIILGREQVQAVLAAMALAVLSGAALPKWLPGRWEPARTKAVAGGVSAVLGLVAAFVLVPTRIGAVYAVLAAFASPTASSAVRQLWYWAQPAAKPESLQP